MEIGEVKIYIGYKLIKAKNDSFCAKKREK